ncbi:MAG: DUF3859 domain-containing protein [Thermodesulfobacteriota bacterium]
MRKLLVLFLALIASACSMVGLGETPSQLEITEYGIFDKGVLVRQTEGVARELGLSFGFRVKVKDPKSGPVKVVITTATPGLLDPSKPKVQMDFVTQATFQPGETYDVFFTFSEPWEMVAGKWVLTVETDKGEVVSRTFDVYNPKL